MNAMFALTNSVPLNGTPVEAVWSALNGRLTAIWSPSSQLSLSPTPLRHFESGTLIQTVTGQIWAISLANASWTEDLVFKASDFLSQKFETLCWSTLETALAQEIERSVVLHQQLLFDRQLSFFQIPTIADALIRRWLSLQSALPDVMVIRKMKAELIREIHASVDRTLAQFMVSADLNLAHISGYPKCLRLDLFNYLAHRDHSRARVQFTKAFPVLADLVCAAVGIKSLGHALGRVVDDLRSPVVFLSDSMVVSPSSVRVLNGVASSDVGQYFFEHPKELLDSLDALPKEFRPRSPDQWKVFRQQYDLAKTFFGRSTAATVLVRARVAHALRFAVQENNPAAQINADETRQIERLRSGMVQATYSHRELEANQSNGIEQRARIRQKVDHHLGRISWSRLLVYSRKFDRHFSEAVANNLQIIDFISGQSYYDFIPGGGCFPLANGCSVRCLKDSSELKLHGLVLDVCLAKAGHRAVYHEACTLGKTTIFGIFDEFEFPMSTAHFDLTRRTSGHIDFRLMQHTGLKNRSVNAAAKDALELLCMHLASSQWQNHAREGLRSSAIRNSYGSQDSEVSAALFLTSLIAFRATFKNKSEDLLAQFSS